MVLKFTIPGKVQPKQSARFTRFGVYQNPKVKAYELEVQRAFREKYKNDVRYPSYMPVTTRIKAFFPIPKRKSFNWKTEAEQGLIRPLVKPDVENLVKGIHDALNDLAYFDDKQIVETTIEKWYSSEPRVEVGIWGLDE